MNVAEAKAKLSQLLAKAEAGEHVVIARAGKPIALIVPPAPPAVRRGMPEIGAWTHLNVRVPDDIWFEPDLEMEEEMEEHWDPDVRDLARAKRGAPVPPGSPYEDLAERVRRAHQEC